MEVCVMSNPMMSDKASLLPDRSDMKEEFGHRCYDCKKELEEEVVYLADYEVHDGIVMGGRKISKEEYDKDKNEYGFSWYFAEVKRKPEKCPHCSSERITSYYKY